MTYEEAIELLNSEYEAAKSIEGVKDPVALAFRNVWYVLDEEEKWRRHGE